MRNAQIYRVVQTGLFIALEVVLSRFLALNTQYVKIGINFIPVVIVAMLHGPVWASAAGALGDMIGAMLFPIGPYFPGFTLTAALCGAVYGLMLRRPRLNSAAAAAVTAGAVCVPLHFGLNTLWLHILYGEAIELLAWMRLVQCAVNFTVQFFAIWFLLGRIRLLKQHGA